MLKQLEHVAMLPTIRPGILAFLFAVGFMLNFLWVSREEWKNRSQSAEAFTLINRELDGHMARMVTPSLN